MRLSFSSAPFLRPQILQATNANPPRMMAPPTPTTTPMTVLRVCVDMPEGELFFPPASAAVAAVVCWLVNVICCPSAPVVVMTIVMVVRTSESGGSNGLEVGSRGGVVDGVGVWDGPGVVGEEELVLGVVVTGGGGGGVVVVTGGGGGVVDEMDDEDGVVTTVVSPVFCRGLIAKPLSAASLASMSVASVTATADSPTTRISRSLW